MIEDGRRDAPGELSRFLHDALRRAEDEREDVADESIEAYVDGRLGDVDREILESRLADDATLRAEVEALRSLRAALAGAEPASPRVLPFTPAPARTPSTVDKAGVDRRILLGGLAAAAVIALVVWQGTRVPRLSPVARAPEATPAPGASPVPPPLSASSGAPLRASLQDGGRSIGLAADGTLAGISGIAPGLERGLIETLRDGRLPASPLARRLDARAGRLMGPGAERETFRPLAPLATAVMTPRPTFQWTPLPGASRYRVRIVDEDLRAVAESAPLTASTWRPDAPLPAGRVLLWQVEAETPGGPRTTPAPPLPDARLVVLAPGEARDVAAALATAPGSDLAAAVIYARAGLHADADAAIARVRAANPGSALAGAIQADLAQRRAGRR